MLRITEVLGEEELRLVKDFFSLSEYEARVYLTLAAMGPMGISKLAEISGVPRTKCYSIARSLISRGIAVKVSSKPFIIAAADPEALPTRFAEERCQEAREKAMLVIQRIRRIRESLGTRSLAGAEKLELAGVLIINSIEDLVASIARDIEGSSREILIAVSGAPIEFPWRGLVVPAINALARGVIIEYATPKNSPVAKHLKLLIEGASNQIAGGFGALLERFRIRESPYIEAPFVVVDEEIVYSIFTDPARKTHLFTIRSRNTRYARSMKIYFNLLVAGQPS